LGYLKYGFDLNVLIASEPSSRKIQTLAPTTAVLLCRMNFSIRMYIPAGKVERAADRY
jgi:hypothetical protein